MATCADHQTIEFAGVGQQFVGGSVEARLAQKPIIGGANTVGLGVGHGCHLIGNTKNLHGLGHVRNPATIADDTNPQHTKCPF